MRFREQGRAVHDLYVSAIEGTFHRDRLPRPIREHPGDAVSQAVHMTAIAGPQPKSAIRPAGRLELSSAPSGPMALLKSCFRAEQSRRCQPPGDPPTDAGDRLVRWDRRPRCQPRRRPGRRSPSHRRACQVEDEAARFSSDDVFRVRQVSFGSFSWIRMMLPGRPRWRAG